jgi:general secretion pathway protein L
MSASADRLLVSATDFLRWWRTELLTLIPEGLRELSREKGWLVLLLSADSAPARLFVETSAAPPDLLAQIPEPGNAESRTSLQAVLQRPEISKLIGRGEFGLCLRIPSRSALCRTIDLPLAAESNLSEVVGFELDRYTPFRADQVYYTHRLLERDAAAQRLSVEITIVPKPVVDEALAIARNLGWTPDRVDVADPSPHASHSNNLLAPTASAARRSGLRATYGLAISAAILAVAAIAIPFAAAEHEAAAMTEEVASLEKQSANAATVGKEILALRSGEDFLLNQKQRSRTMSELLAQITHLLPDDTWLTDLRVTGSDVELTGVSASASRLVGILEQSGQFRDTNFHSPVTADQGSGKERFSIVTHLVQEHRR